MIRELRVYISELLLGWAMAVMPANRKEKQGMAIAIVAYYRQIGMNITFSKKRETET